jgi:hypothetical protein
MLWKVNKSYYLLVDTMSLFTFKGSCSYSRENKLFNIVGNRFYIPKKYRLIELRMQGGYLRKIDFSEMVWIIYEFPKLIIVDHYFRK